MGALTFLLGGARSGKSQHAERLVEAHSAPWFYIATAQAFDDEMQDRIALHVARRDRRWTTIDAPLDLVEAIASVPDGRPLLLDCLTLWLTNIILADRVIEKECRHLVETLKKSRGPWFVVSNEVGLGIVPENALARCFRDAAGHLNQMVAAEANDVLFMVAGLPLKVK